MQWYKHDTNATIDSKVRKLIMRHGANGYAVYFHCLELIMGSISKDNMSFMLEHDAEIIADDLRIAGANSIESGAEHVGRIMNTIVELKLFESDSEKRIYCFKLAQRMDCSMTSNKAFRDAIANVKERYTALTACNHDTVMTQSNIGHDLVMQEENRTDKKRTEENRRDKKREDGNFLSQNACSSDPDCEEGEIIKPSKPPEFESYIPKPDYDKIFLEVSAKWNSYDILPEARAKMGLVNFPNYHEILLALKTYSDAEIISAIENYVEFFECVETKYQTFGGFMKKLESWVGRKSVEARYQGKSKHGSSDLQRQEELAKQFYPEAQEFQK